MFRFILGVKEGDHSFLFEQIRIAEREDRTTTFEIVDQNNPKIIHRFRFLNHVPLNASNQDLLVNFLEYWEITPNKTKHFSWITDFIIDKSNAYILMRGGRATSEESTLSSISENNVIGWSSLISPYTYKLSAYCASSRCKVLVINRKPLHAYLTKHPKIGYRVMSVLLQVVGHRFQKIQGASDHISVV